MWPTLLPCGSEWAGTEAIITAMLAAETMIGATICGYLRCLKTACKQY
jgi:hypothetical protein